MTVKELIDKLHAMPQDLLVYWDNSEGMGPELVQSVQNEMTQFSLYELKGATFEFLGHEVRDVVILSWREGV